MDPPLSPGGSTSLHDRCKLAFADLEFGPALSAGAFGSVCAGRFKGSAVAIKSVSLRHLGGDAKYLFGELAALASVSHPHLLRFHGAAEGAREASRPELHIVTELMGGGALSALLAPPAPPLPWALRVALCRAAAEGLAHLHAEDMLHRDIKTENLLLAEGEWRLVLADFGFSKHVADLRGGARQAMTVLGTEAYMAPEVVFGEAYGEGADTFSLGCVIAAVIARREPGAGGFLERSPRSKFAVDVEQLRAAAPPDTPPSFLECALQCLAYEPEARPAADVVAEWLRDLEKELPPFDAAAFPLPGQLRAAARADKPRVGGGGGESGGGEALEP
jgi:LIM domain kinase 1